jgi:hypothetical protein
MAQYYYHGEIVEVFAQHSYEKIMGNYDWVSKRQGRPKRRARLTLCAKVRVRSGEIVEVFIVKLRGTSGVNISRQVQKAEESYQQMVGRVVTFRFYPSNPTFGWLE